MSEKPTALIIGASRGLGLGLSREYLHRGWSVLGTVRRGSGQTALHELQKASDALEIEYVGNNQFAGGINDKLSFLK
ncbi:Rossmann-fold NAD(P)-binding domain-containing protein [Paraburkholderia xenovorans]|uniref:hypothetical protein n=1 Tax=Paraburkholderia xenovorans TaxID=36873 RepID=UPI0038BCC856